MFTVHKGSSADPVHRHPQQTILPINFMLKTPFSQHAITVSFTGLFQSKILPEQSYVKK